MLEIQSIIMSKNKPLSFPFKYLAIALPLLFIAPILVTIGFKNLKADNSYSILILGILFLILAIITTALGILKVTQYIFNKDNAKD